MTAARPGYYLGDNRILTVTDRGDRMYLDTRDIMITPGVLCWGDWEPETTLTLEEVLRPGMRWVDIGANVGYFTVIGHKLVREGGGQTWAFEANPATYTFLVENVRLNWFFDGCTTEQKAVYSRSTTLRFSAPEKYAVNATLGTLDPVALQRASDSLRTFEVPAVALDDYFKDADVTLDFLKIDIEGAEVFALRGARETLARNRDVKLLIEWSPDQMSQCGTSPEETIAEIRQQGFSCMVAEGERREVRLEDLLAIRETTMLLLYR